MEWSSYDSVFSPFFFIFWDEEVDDYLNMQIPLSKEPDEELLAEVEQIVAELSLKYLPSGDFTVPDEVIYQPVSSSGHWNQQSKAEWEIEYDAPDSDLPTDRLVFLRSQAMKRPSETRDIGLHTPPSLRLHREIMFPMQRACKRLPSVYGRDRDALIKTVQDFGESCRYYFMRDYTKSGMSIPHDVMSAVIRGFYARRPDLGEKYSKAFLNSVVWIKQEDGSWDFFHPTTGLPLGMFVEGYTLLQYAIDIMVKSRNPLLRNIKFDATNDDMIAGHLSEELVSAYADADFFINQGLRMSVKTSKTGISCDRFFYCEEYWDGDKILSKESQCTLALLGAKYAINVVHAKELVNAILQSLPYSSKVVDCF
jgi:hypothetical protein